jgi:uncharacterized protein (DUF1015 family)
MALVCPFKGFRYNKEIVRDVNSVVTQPYDKTTPAMQEAYYRRSPYNVVRITLNLEKRKDPDTDYADAGSTLRRWIDQRVLIQDPLPSLYAYYQEYTIEGQPHLQKGFIALLDLKNAETGIIPHEHTLAAPKQDRLRLMRSTEANEDLIYMLYADEKLTVNRILDESVSGRAPEIEARDEYDAVHRIWAVTDPNALRSIQQAMSTRDLFIADGHHRFETSVAFMKECEQRQWKPVGVESFEKRMVTCFNSVDGVTILPTHRLVRDLAKLDVESFLQEISRQFEITPARSATDLWENMRRAAKENAFGFYAGSRSQFYLIRPKRDASEGGALKQEIEACGGLDVAILHKLLLERHLGIDESKLADQSHIDYVREREACIRMVDEGRYQAAFFLNPTTAEQMQNVASRGERMPQKSTDFFPKLLTGLVFMRMRIKK